MIFFIFACHLHRSAHEKNQPNAYCLRFVNDFDFNTTHNNKNGSFAFNIIVFTCRRCRENCNAFRTLLLSFFFVYFKNQRDVLTFIAFFLIKSDVHITFRKNCVAPLFVSISLSHSFSASTKQLLRNRHTTHS